MRIIVFILLVAGFVRGTGLATQNRRCGRSTWLSSSSILRYEGEDQKRKGVSGTHILREATVSDFEGLKRLLEACGMVEFSSLPLREAGMLKDQMVAALDDGMFICFCDDESDEILGAVCFETIHDMSSPCNRCSYISHLAVHKSARRQGIAKQLLADAATRSLELGGSGTLCLLVDRENTGALAFYSSLPGFSLGANCPRTGESGRYLRQIQERWLRMSIDGSRAKTPAEIEALLLVIGNPV